MDTSCEVCRKNFPNCSELNCHMRAHTDKKPFQCGVCETAFSQKDRLLAHVKIHSEEKQYQCYECDREFSILGNLNRHMAVHTEKKLFKCKVCNFRVYVIEALCYVFQFTSEFQEQNSFINQGSDIATSFSLI